MPTTIKTPRMGHVLIASPLLSHDGDRPRFFPLAERVLVTPLIRSDPQRFGVVPEDPWSGLTHDQRNAIGRGIRRCTTSRYQGHGGTPIPIHSISDAKRIAPVP